jgi:hypothetical protein
MSAVTASRAVLTVAYDLGDSAAWGEACRHARLWSRLYVDTHSLDKQRVVLVFRPAPDERWRDWERVRAQWILGELAA